MTTKADIRQMVGEELGLVPIGQTLEAQDQARIDAAYDYVYDQLREKGLASWASSGSVPDRIVPYVCLLIEEKLLIAYSVPESRMLRVKTSAGEGGSLAFLKLAELSVQEYTSTDLPQDY
jgi:hypothetical protein